MQRILNGHMSQWIKVVGCGDNWSQMDRFRSTTLNTDATIPPLYILIKDHKKPNSDGTPKTRPVVSGNSSMNVHLNNLLADLIEPTASSAEDSPEVISTEDSLKIIDDFNSRQLKLTSNSNERREIRPCICPSTQGEENKNKSKPRVVLTARRKITIKSWLEGGGGGRRS